jgi:hypothetical protein
MEEYGKNSTHGEGENSYKTLAANPKRKTKLRRRRGRREDNIKMNFIRIKCEGLS